MPEKVVNIYFDHQIKLLAIRTGSVVLPDGLRDIVKNGEVSQCKNLVENLGFYNFRSISRPNGGSSRMN
jgi:hypothetical protein